MRKVAIRALHDSQKSVLMTLNRFLYVLKPVSEADNLVDGSSVGYKIQSKIEREATQHFEVFEESDWLVATDEANKFVNFYSLSEFVNAKSNTFPLAKHQQ